jgi:hypothetical protein
MKNMQILELRTKVLGLFGDALDSEAINIFEALGLMEEVKQRFHDALAVNKKQAQQAASESN